MNPRIKSLVLELHRLALELKCTVDDSKWDHTFNKKQLPPTLQKALVVAQADACDVRDALAALLRVLEERSDKT